MKCILTFILLGLTITSCADSGINSTIDSNEIVDNTFIENSLSFEMILPENWDNGTNISINGATAKFVSKNEPKDNFAANIVCFTSEHSGSDDLSESLEGYLQQMSSQVEDLTLISHSIITIDDIEVGIITYTAVLNSIAYKCTELMFFRNGYDVQITCTDRIATFDSIIEFKTIENNLSFSE